MKNKIKTKLIKSCLSSTVLGAVLLSPINDANSVAYQIFFPLTYTNPASLSTVNKFSATLGATNSFIGAKFKGTQGTLSGQSKSNTYGFLPYGQIMYRIHPEWVLGFTVSNPVYSNINFKNGPLTGIRTTVFSKVYTTQVSYQILDKLAIGMGVDVGQVHNFNVDFPTPIGRMTNKAKGTKVGFDAGFLYKIKPTTLLYGSYFSRMKRTVPGKSTLNNASRDMRMSGLIPNTWTLNLVQILSKEWLVSLTGRYVNFKQRKIFEVSNTALGPVISQVRNRDGWAVNLSGRYQFASQWAGLAFIAYDSNVQPLTARPVGLPADMATVGGFGFQFLPTKELQVQLAAGIGTLNPKFRNGTTTGRMKLIPKYVDLSMTYKF